MLKIECDKKSISVEFEGAGLDMIALSAIVIKKLKDNIVKDSGMPAELVDRLLESAMSKVK